MRRVLKKIRGTKNEEKPVTGETPKQKITLPVNARYISTGRNESKKAGPTAPPYTINWVLPVFPGNRISGGHMDIFHAVQQLENKGHTCRLYFHDASFLPDATQLKQQSKSYPPVKAQFIGGVDDMKSCDIIFATNWPTAYPVNAFKKAKKKIYFVQDFEPYFHPAGTLYSLAESTYKLGFHGLTLDRWLTDKLAQEYGMRCDYFDISYDPQAYYRTKTPKKNKVFFYARPSTPRRGFELGVLALEIFHKAHPQYEVCFVGADSIDFEIPFPYVNLGTLKADQLNRLYNESKAGLVLSFSNMSLTPMEMLACNCVPVINKGQNTEAIGYKRFVQYAEPTPKALAEGLWKATSGVKDADSRALTNLLEKCTWDKAGEKIDRILTRLMSK